MKEDPIIAEIHEIRRQIMEECHHDPKEFQAMLKRTEMQYADFQLPTSWPKLNPR